MAPASTSFGGFTGAQICTIGLGQIENWSGIELTNVTFFEAVTTKAHGLRGKVFATTIATSPPALLGTSAPDLGVGLACTA